MLHLISASMPVAVSLVVRSIKREVFSSSPASPGCLLTGNNASRQKGYYLDFRSCFLFLNQFPSA